MPDLLNAPFLVLFSLIDAGFHPSLTLPALSVRTQTLRRKLRLQDVLRALPPCFSEAMSLRFLIVFVRMTALFGCRRHPTQEHPSPVIRKGRIPMVSTTGIKTSLFVRGKGGVCSHAAALNDGSNRPLRQTEADYRHQLQQMQARIAALESARIRDGADCADGALLRTRRDACRIPLRRMQATLERLLREDFAAPEDLRDDAAA